VRSGLQHLRIACLQLGYPPGEPKTERVPRVVGLIAEAAVGADLVVLPELWSTGYFSFDRYAAEAELLQGQTITTLRQTASRHRIHLMAGTFVERHDQSLSNCAVLIGPDGNIMHTYRKVHLFGYESQESRLLTPGDDVTVVPTVMGTVGTTTCYDLRFPELYRLLVDQGARLIIVPAAWPAARLEHWQLLLRARALENQVVVVACNGAGPQEQTELAGHSMVVGPWGQIVAEAGGEEQILRAELDLAEVERVRMDFPVLDHRRIRVESLGSVPRVLPRPGG